MVILRIDDILREKGMTEKELARRMGVSQQAVNSVIRCRENPSIRKLKRYAEILDVPLKDLFEEI